MIPKMLIKEPSPTYPPVTQIVYRPNERVKFSDSWIKKRNLGHKEPWPLTNHETPVARRPLSAIKPGCRTRASGGGHPKSAIVNNLLRPTSPRTPLRGSPTTFDRRGARAREHAARPPARFSSLLSVEPHNQKPKTSPLRFAHGETKVPNSFQDLTFWDNFQFSIFNPQCSIQPRMLVHSQAEHKHRHRTEH